MFILKLQGYDGILPVCNFSTDQSEMTKRTKKELFMVALRWTVGVFWELNTWRLAAFNSDDLLIKQGETALFFFSFFDHLVVEEYEEDLSSLTSNPNLFFWDIIIIKLINTYLYK